MAAVFAVAKQSLGESEGQVMFIVVTDGATTQFLFPEDMEEGNKLELLNAFMSRKEGLPPTDDPDATVAQMTYNMPVNWDASDPYPTYEDALTEAQAYLNSYDPYANNPIAPRDAAKVDLLHGPDETAPLH